MPEDRSKGWEDEGVGEGTTTSSSVTLSASAPESVRPIETSRSRPNPSAAEWDEDRMWWRKRRYSRGGGGRFGNGGRICEETVRAGCGLLTATNPAGSHAVDVCRGRRWQGRMEGNRRRYGR